MKIDKQIKEANEATKKLHRAIVELNNILNKRGEGCYINRIEYTEPLNTDNSTLSIRYMSNNTECNAFVCSSVLAEG